MKIIDIAVKYEEVRNLIAQKMQEILKQNDGVLKLTEEQSKKMEYYTTSKVVEVGLSENVSKGVYIKIDGGTLYSFDILSTDNMYAMLNNVGEIVGVR